MAITPGDANTITIPILTEPVLTPSPVPAGPESDHHLKESETRLRRELSKVTKEKAAEPSEGKGRPLSTTSTVQSMLGEGGRMQECHPPGSLRT